MWKYVPNMLTFARLGLTIVFLAMILYWPHVADRPSFLDIAFVLFVIAGLTDIVDGHVARRWNATSKFGRIIDPLVDKVLVCGAFICFALIGEPKLFHWGPATLGIFHWAVAGILVMREAYVTILRHLAEARGVNFAAVAIGQDQDVHPGLRDRDRAGQDGPRADRDVGLLVHPCGFCPDGCASPWPRGCRPRGDPERRQT